jgi:hypothetical protein
MCPAITLDGFIADPNGEGIPLFGSHKPKLTLKLLSTAQEIEGIIENHYRVEK